ncbi:hypothetical protein BGZ81_003561 [Podila clonocystis]|nr:hypothetical protein BGZ81_003561 [Podila clonocystis]
MAHSYAPSSIQYATHQAVLDFFQDPPNVDRLKLLAQHRGQLLSDMSDDKKASDKNICGIEGKHELFCQGEADYDGIQFNLSSADERHNSRIFLTAHYLKDYIERLVLCTKDLHKINLSVDSCTFRNLASSLNCYESDLTNVSPDALATLYFQMVNAKRCLDAHLAISPSVHPLTHMFEIAGDLVDLDDKIQKAYDALEAVNESEAIEDSVQKNDTMSHDNDTIDTKEARYKGRVDYKGVLYDFSNKDQNKKNRPRIFLTALFIKDRMKRMVEGAYDGISGLRELHKANLTVSSRTFSNLAVDLKETPSLKGISTEALVTLYFQIVNAKRCLDAHLALPGKSRSFKQTRMAEIAEQLVGYDDKIQAAKEAWRASVSIQGGNDSETIGSSMKDHGTEVSDMSCGERSPSPNLAEAAPAPQPNTRSNASPSAVSRPSSVPATSTIFTTAEPSLPPEVSTLGPFELPGVNYDGMEKELLRMRKEQVDMQAMYKMQHEDMLAMIKAQQDDMLDKIKMQFAEVEARNKVQDEQMTLIKSMQSTIETLQKRLDTVEGDLSKSKEYQELLEQRVVNLTEQCDEQQVSITRLDFGLEGMTSRMIRHEKQIKGLEGRMV